MQVQNSGEQKPVAYISRSMSQTEQCYAQIEKEALAFTWACERFAEYLKFHIQTDHKPLVYEEFGRTSCSSTTISTSYVI